MGRALRRDGADRRGGAAVKISKHEAKFLLAAVSKDETRMPINAPAVCDMRGKRWICGTDGHRLHAVLAPDQTFPLGFVLIAKDGDVASLERPGAKFPPVEQVWEHRPEHDFVNIERTRLFAVASSGHAKVCALFTRDEHKARPRLHISGDPAPHSAVAVRSSYVYDAIMLADGKKYRYADVQVSTEGPLDLVQFMPNGLGSELNWCSIVMPMRV